jgi:hypothetical protein
VHVTNEREDPTTNSEEPIAFLSNWLKFQKYI